MSLPTVAQVQERLGALFPTEFPDRSILVGIMAARVVFVALYGGFIEGRNAYFRPSTVTDFSDEQAALASDIERAAWAAVCHKNKHTPIGQLWYKKGTREPIRDDLIRIRFMPMNAVLKLEGYSVTHPSPIYSLAADFAALFDPALADKVLKDAIAKWRDEHLDPLTLKRMTLIGAGVKARKNDVTVKLPAPAKLLQLTAGEASIITRDVCEVFSKNIFKDPVIVHVSSSDKKVFPELAEVARKMGLVFDPKVELPDVVIADVSRSKVHLAFVEVVHSDGVVHAHRAKALLKLAGDAGIPADHVLLATAFEDRGADGFRKRFSELAVGSFVWFRTEPDMVMRLEAFQPPEA